MSGHVIEQLELKDYEKCSNIWNMSTCEFTEKFRKEIEEGNRTVYIYKIDGTFIGEIACVREMHDPDYTIPGRRIYISRLLVKREYRNRGSVAF